MTETNTTMGTLAYMPPEAFDALVRQDHQGDVWSLGIILFEMLTGTLPFRAHSQSELVAAVLSDPPLALSQFRKDVPAAWESIIIYALQKDVSKRYPTVRDLHNDLRADQCTVYFSDADFDTQTALADAKTTPDNIEQLETEHIEQLANTAEPYQFQFINKAQPAPTPKTPARQPKRKVADIGSVDFDKENPLKTRGVNVMIFGGVFSWLGMIVMISAAVFAVLRSLQSDPSSQHTMLIGFGTTGTILFIIGCTFEILIAEKLERLLLAGAMSGAVCTAVFTGFASYHIDFLAGVLAAFFSLATASGYLGAKGFG